MFGDQYITIYEAKKWQDKILRIGIISDEEEDTWWRRKLSGPLSDLCLAFHQGQWHKAAGLNLEAEAKPSYSWKPLMGTKGNRVLDLTWPTGPTGAQGFSGVRAIWASYSLRGLTRKEQGGRGQRPFRGSQPASCGCIRWGWRGKAARGHMPSTAAESGWLSGSWRLPPFAPSANLGGSCSQCSVRRGSCCSHVLLLHLRHKSRAFFLIPP